jgi:hypothetical protein
MEHLCKDHSSINLKKFGLNKKLLLKFIAFENDKLEIKRSKKRQAKKDSKEKAKEITISTSEELLHARKQLNDCKKF